MQKIKFLIKSVGIQIFRFFMRVLCFIPIKSNRIVFTSQMGEQYSCNPKYISEYLNVQYPEKFEIIWLFNEPEKYSFLSAQNVKVVGNHSFKKMFYELTAKVSVINNGTRYARMPLRKDQLHINTWHGGGYYKHTGINGPDRNEYMDRQVWLASKNTSYYLSTNKCFTDYVLRNEFGYDGKVLNIGFPRNDIFFHCDYMDIHKKVCDYFEIKENCKILLYAPTFRDYTGKNFEMPDFDKIMDMASKRFGGEWVVFIRAHYLSGLTFDISNTYNANYSPEGPEMQELLASSDLLITDYSSSIWDYSFTYRPCLLFTPDLDDYIASRGFCSDIYDWGFPVCKTEKELWGAIENFDEDSFREAMERHHERLGSFEHGNATEIVGKLIYDFCYPE